MPERKTWTSQEDSVLKTLREQDQICKWSSIAKIMNEEYSMPLRTGKQCRERYHNHLDSNILRSQWSHDEEQYLYRMHDQIGNKWAIIAQKLPGRTDNCVKNHFYSKMRKAIRKLSKVVQIHFRKQIKEIKLNVLYKIVEATDEKFKVNPAIDEEISDRCCQLKNMLLQYADEDDDEESPRDLDKLYELALMIHEISSRYRKRPKRSRRSSAHGAQIISLGKMAPKYRSANSDHELESDEEESEHQIQYSIKTGSKLESVKEEDEAKDGGWTGPSFTQRKQFTLEFEGLEQKPQTVPSLYSYYMNEQISPPNYQMEQENNPINENMLSEEIERLNLSGDYNLREVEVDDYELLI